MRTDYYHSDPENWCVVIRRYDEPQSRGNIVIAGISKQLAIKTRDELLTRPNLVDWNVWAMLTEDY